MEFTKMKKQLLQLQDTDYRNFVKALVSIETNCTDEEKLESMYDRFMEDDSASLLDTFITEKINSSDKFIKNTSRKDYKNE